MTIYLSYGGHNMDVTKLRNAAVGALFSGHPDVVDRIEETGGTVIGFAAEIIDDHLWIILSTPELGEVARYRAEYLIQRYRLEES